MKFLWFLLTYPLGYLHYKRLTLLALISAILILLLLTPTFRTYADLEDDLFTKENILNYNKTGVVLLDKNGKEFYRFYNVKDHAHVSINELPQHLKNSIISAEDDEFYYHNGFSLKAMVAAVIADIKLGDLAFGGSTITQQLVKNSLLNADKTITRKYQELVLAQELEKRFTKDDILEMYLNSAYFGEGAFGIQNASRIYFGKDARDLSLSESALLAGLLSAPSRLSPISGDKEASIQKQHFILNELVQDKLLTKEDAETAKKEPLVFNSKLEKLEYKAPHFAILVRDQLISKYGEAKVARSGFKVHTTLDLNWQQQAEEAVKKQVAQLKKRGTQSGAAVVMESQSAKIRALVGSIDWNEPKFGKTNMALIPRQPGSTFKPIVYATALDKNIITPATILKDIPTTFQKDYKPQNYDNRFRGPVLVRRALANSLNVPSVQLMSMVGIPQVLDVAKNLGITTLDDPQRFGLSLVLGSGEVSLLEMTNVYATLANSGQKNNPTTIEYIQDKFGNIIYTDPLDSEQVFSPQSSFLVTSILSDQKARREMFGSALDTQVSAAVKTGTSSDYRDSLTIGYTPDLTIGVWVGNPDNKPMDQVAGSLGAAPIWKDLITRFTDFNTAQKFTQPDRIVTLSVCSHNGLPVTEATSSAQTEYFIEGTIPKGRCNIPKPIIAEAQPPNQLPANPVSPEKDHQKN